MTTEQNRAPARDGASMDPMARIQSNARVASSASCRPSLARGAQVVAMSCAALVVAGCAAHAEGESEVGFAHVSGSAQAAPGRATVLNLLVTAPADDDIWSDGIHELVVENDAEGGGDLVYGGGAVPLEPGSESAGTRVGTIPVEMPADADAFELSTIVITAREGDEPRRVDVGDWTYSGDAVDPRVQITGDYPVSMPDCGHVQFEVEGVDETSVGVRDVRLLDVPGVSVDDVEITEAGSGRSRVSFDLRCDDDADVRMLTPVITAVVGGDEFDQPIDPLLVGYVGLSEADVSRIASRSRGPRPSPESRG